MKRTFLLKMMLLLCALVAGSSSVWAVNAEITSFSALSGNIDSHISYATYQGDGTTAPALSGTNIRIYKPASNKSTGGYITITAASGYKISSITITNSDDKAGTIKYKVDNGELSSNVSLNKEASYTVSSINASSVSFYNCGSDRLSIAGLSVTYSSTGGGSTPSISLSVSSINAPVTGVSNGSITVTYDNITTVDSEVLFYESDGTTTATYDWMSAEINSTSKNVNYTISANTSYARKAYMKVHQKNTEVYSGLITISQIGAIYTVNIQTPTGGTLEVKNGETPISDGDAVANGTTLTITPTASSGYRFRNWQAIDTSTHTNTTNYTYTISDHDVTIKANFDLEYNVNWSVNGIITSTGTFIANEAIVFPNRPADVQGKKFVGWGVSEIAGTQTDAPTLLEYGTKMGTSNITYYAVFADASGESSTAKLTSSEISSNLANTTMAYGTERTYTDTSDGITWVASGYTDVNARPWIQLKKANNAYFKVTTLKDIEEVKLTISSGSNTSGGITDITKHDPFTGIVCLESEAKGTPTGAIASSNVVSDNTVTVSLPVSLKEFYIQVTAGARVWGIELTTNNYTYTNYCTTVSTTATITLADACTDGNFYYGTYSNGTAFVVPSDLIVSEISVIDGQLYIEDYDTDDVVPANTGVLVVSNVAGDHTVTLTAEAGTSKLGDDNMLKPSGDNGVTASDMADTDYYYYRLTMYEGKPGFWWKSDNGAGFALAANKAYLKVPTSEAGTVASLASGFTLGDHETTGVNDVRSKTEDTRNEVYNLAGQRVTQPTKGLYIVNGHKVVIK